jgi:predicted outer membrane repeat protein
MRSSSASLHTKRVRQFLRFLALLLVACLLSVFAPPAPQLAALPSSFHDLRALRADAVTSSNRISPTLDPRYPLEGVQTAKLQPADLVRDASFGYAMAISGDTLVVSARGTQLAYVFTRDQASGAWQQAARLGPGTPPAGGTFFAQSIAIDGDTIVVGSFEPMYSHEGMAYIYGRNQGGTNAWGLVTTLQAHDPFIYRYFGSSVAINGDTVVIGAPGNDDSFGAEVGAAYVFERNQGGVNQWGEAAKLSAADSRNWDLFGQAVAIDGDTIAVGAPRDTSVDSRPGATYTFERNVSGSSAWQQIARLEASDSSSKNEFGAAVALNGDTLVVGAVPVGAAYIYQRDAGGSRHWGERKKLMASDNPGGAAFGYAVAVQNDRIAVGATDAVLADYQGGAAYVYDRNAGGIDNWGEQTRLLPHNEPDYGAFGSAVALRADEVLVGAYNYQYQINNTGAAFAFRLYPRPHLGDDTAATDEELPVAISVLSNDSTPAATGSLDPASVKVAAAPAHGATSVNLSSGAITYTPQHDFNGLDSFVYSAGNSVGTSQTATVTVTVRPVNDPPEFISTAPPRITAYSPYRYSITAHDVDSGDTLTVTAPIKPAWLTLAATGNGSAVLSGTPTDADAGEHALSLRVTDAGGLSATQTYTLTVAPNTPPRFVSTPPTYVMEGELYRYPITAVDPDAGQALTITAPLLPSWLQLGQNIQGTTILTGTPDYTAVGDQVVRLRVDDPGRLSDTQTFTLTVSPDRPAPPAGLLAVPISASAIRLSWYNISVNALGVNIERRSTGGVWANVATVGASVATYIDQGLQCGLTYEYRVSAYNQHWSSNPGNVASAAPSDIAPRSFTTDTPQIQIPATGRVTESIVVADPGAIADLDVRVEIDHIYDGDLILSLIAPDGAVVLLSAGNGGPGHDYQGTIFDNEATTPIGSGYAPFSGRYHPQGPLGGLYGKLLAGTWTLQVENRGAFLGVVKSWGLDFSATTGCPGIPPTPTFTPTPSVTPTLTPTPGPTMVPSSTPTNTPTPRPAMVIYVKADDGAPNNGSSWAQAFTKLQDALTIALPGDSIWVAAGTYTPSADGNRNSAFQLVNGVALYGGFAGTETALDQRNWETNSTILSGDLGVVGDPSDNSLTVISSNGATATTILDGFTIANGGVGLSNDHSSPALRNLIVRDNRLGVENNYSNSALTNITFSGNSGGSQGGGMFNYASNLTLQHTTFISNTATEGAGMYNLYSSPALTDITLIGNIATAGGGGMYNDIESNPTLNSVIFRDNKAWQGGGMYGWNSRVTLHNVTFSHNSVTGSGGALYQMFKSAMLDHVTFDSNTAYEGGAIQLAASYAGLNDVTFNRNIAQNEAGSGGAIDITNQSSSSMINVRFIGNSAGLHGGALAIGTGSGAQLINTLFSSNAALAEDGGGIYNEGVLKIYNTTFWHNTAQKNGGALSDYTGGVTLLNSIFWDNAAGSGGPHIFCGITPYIGAQYNLIQGGYPGTGNVSGDPLFVNPNGVDGIPGTLDDDLHLGSGSAAIDAGSNAAVPVGTLADLDHNSRFADDPSVADTGSGAPPLVDMGAYERFAGPAPTPTNTPLPTSTPTPSATPVPPLPMVVKINTSPDTGDGQLSEGEIVRGAVDYLWVTFNTDITKFRRQAFILLIEGDQPGFQTTSCARPSPGDQLLFSSFQSFQLASRTIVLGFYPPKGSTLPDGRYRFIVCDTVTGAYPLLDGDGDGTPGGDFMRNFTIDRTPLTPTPTATTTDTPTSTATAIATTTATSTATATTATSTATATATTTATSTATATATTTPISVPTSTPASTPGLLPHRFYLPLVGAL